MTNVPLMPWQTTSCTQKSMRQTRYKLLVAQGRTDRPSIVLLHLARGRLVPVADALGESAVAHLSGFGRIECCLERLG